VSNPENIRLVWNQFSTDLKSFIFSKVRNEADTDDILQNAFLKIHDNISSLKDSSKIKPWIYQVTRNLIIDYFREKQKNENPELIFKDLIPAVTGKKMDEAIQDMISMMEDLPPEYREALCMTEIEGMSQKEYAETKGLSYSGAKSRVQRARILLKTMLLECCHYQFDRYGTVYDIEPRCCCCDSQSHKS
jgi:RNA polymerase sigma-70 factor, ECF subfamily